MDDGNNAKRKPTVKLIGEDGNAFNILGRVKNALREAGMDAEADAFLKEATSGDYRNVLRCAMKYCDVE